MDKDLDKYIWNRHSFWAGYRVLDIPGGGSANCYINKPYILGDKAQGKTASVCLNVTIDITIKE